MAFWRRWGSRRGQALTEVALLTPVAILLVLGGYDTSVMGSDKVLATSAVRNGVRLASELGGYGNTTAGNNTCNGTLANGTNTTANMDALDQAVIKTVLATTANMTYLGSTNANNIGKPDEIDIYRPSAADGKFVSTDPHETFFPSSIAASNFVRSNGSNWYTLDLRCQGPLENSSNSFKEAEIGVRMLWTYKPANGIPGPTISFSDYSVEKENLCSENCVR